MGAVGGLVTSIFDGGATQDAINASFKSQQQTQAAIAESDRKTLLAKNRDQDRIAQKADVLKNQGMAGTILTSPLGVTGSTSTTNNTLLGS